ncbi:putative solute-binding protein, partial [Escherichia coli]|uniref:putative solute-binding protein n=1 Tax=Escherichia coli TaxID=562 RepID=UPI0039DF3B6D
GAGYAVCNDKSIHGIAGAVGKRVAIPNFDKSLVVVVNGLNAVPVPVDLMSYGTVFAQGKADCLMIPLVLYKPLEIDKALEKNGGGIVR